ncbi:FMN-binding protein [Actinoplanes sp. RD1]|uniref:FMN-binding protein n=1 Tax=Actinoplanes sp. RD1 TaxID=3064538 RepID=UPI0027420F1D|nr:FMN-binding protein [Actinoplanes sp. RD1]
MRRSTAAAVGTLTGAALIIGVRLSVATPAAPIAAPAAVDLSDPNLDEEPAATPAPGKSGSKSSSKGSDSAGEAAGGSDESDADEGADSGLKNGDHQGEAVKNPYGTIQVTIRVSGGKITAAGATYPTTGESATINPPAIATLKQETLKAQSADIDAVSGATFTSESYVKSLQAALDKAGA